MLRKTNLLIADDHALMREGLKHLFALVDDLRVVAEAANSVMLLERLRQDDIDLLLLDLNMPGLHGEDLVACIHAQHPNVKTLVLSMHNEPQIALRTLKAGAAGYLCKDCSLDTLLFGIRRVASGARFIDPQIAEFIALNASALKKQTLHDTLTERELQILCLFARGVSVTQIAESLAISSKTVSTHKARLMEKMNFSSNAEIVRYAVSQLLIK